jgi:transposase-like protein
MKRFSPVEQLSILRRHFVDNIPVSQLCEEYGVIAEQYCDWQRLFFERGAVAFKRQEGTREDRGTLTRKHRTSRQREKRLSQASFRLDKAS